MYGINNWLTRLKSYGADTCFDVASCWGYSWTGHPEELAASLQWDRTWLPDAGCAPRPFVFTEFGGLFDKDNPPTRAQRAYHLSKSYPVLEAANATPGYPALQGAWFTFAWQYMQNPDWPITGPAPSFPSWEPAYAYQQWTSLATGADYEGRIPFVGESTCVYQFEDSQGKKFWTAWAATPYPPGPGGSPVSIPARSDFVDTMSTQTEATQYIGGQSSCVTGWVNDTLDSIPLIIIERAERHRPDISVDSVWYTYVSGPSGPVVFHALLRNHGTDSTPTSPAQVGPSTRVRFYLENQQVSQTNYFRSLYEDSTAIVSASDTFALPHPQPLLCRVTANEEQLYVELGMNDNAGYLLCGSGSEGEQSGGRTDLPKILSLGQPRPNPAKAALRLKYALPRQTQVSVKLFDIAGTLVKTLATGEQAPGYYDLTWDCKDNAGRTVARGVYFCTMEAENQRFSRKVILTE